jgi:hypothetical protein
MTARNLSLAERFMLHVEPEPMSGCFLWTGAIDRAGYGRFLIGRVNHLAHRVAWTIRYGKVPDGAFVLHSCDMRECVSTDHLFCGSNQENMRDMAAKQRGRKSKAGLPFGVRLVTGKGSLSNPFQASVKFEGRKYYLGVHPTIESAHAVAIAFKQSLYQRPVQTNGTMGTTKGA